MLYCLTYKQPLPTRQPIYTIQPRINTRLQIPAKHASRRRGSMKDASPLPQLIRLVPAAQNRVGRGIKARLGEPDEEANGHDLVRGRGRRETKRQQGPDELARGDPDGGPHARQDHLRWDLAGDVAHGPGRVHQVDLVPRHGQVLLHAAHKGVGHVSLV